MSWFKKLFTRKLHADIARLREQRDKARQQREQWRMQAEELAKERECLLLSLQSASAKTATPIVTPAVAGPAPLAPDGLFTLHGADFRNDPAFQKAYAAGVAAAGARPLFQTPMKLTQRPVCPICGASDFSSQKVLWEELITDWALRPDEVDYIDLQQGFSCKRCNTALRCMTLASAMMAARGFRGTFTEFCDPAGPACGLDVLEINSAGNLTTYLSRLPRHKLASYPEIDMQQMPFEEAAFDIVVHSDTLDHVPDSRRGLAECLRVLRPGGILVYTIPLVVGRTTRKRAGLKDSFHGRPGESDYRVETEYGADFWCELMEAGFGEVRVHTLLYPASVAIVATKTGQWQAPALG